MTLLLCYTVLLFPGQSFTKPACSISSCVLPYESDQKVAGSFCSKQKKSDDPILSISMAVSHAAGTRRGSFFYGQATSGQKIVKNHGISRG
jgi:hypothetical protein